MVISPNRAAARNGVDAGGGLLGVEWLRRHSDLAVVFFVLVAVLMLVVPLPPRLLDVLLAMNISFALLVLLLTMNVRQPLELSMFPSLLLMVTLFRLALNVSATRLILLNGFAGDVINAFGNFVVGGNYAVGFVVFLIIIIIQFIVITKGAERVAEVAARFTLDAMPGKQMSIDADLNAGLINEEDARARRQEIEREADFYGAMDGASKFVKGDAIAAVIIIIVNILGGFLVGIVQKGLPFDVALQRYTLLTIGDGLVTQIPALLVSVATGILVTRTASQENLGHDILAQLGSQPKVLGMAAAALGFFALVPGLPTLPFLVLAATLGFLAYSVAQSLKRLERDEEEQSREEELETARRPENVLSLLTVDPIVLQIGYGLIPLVDPAQGGDLFDRVTLIRRQLALDLGIVIPAIRVQDNMQLKPTAYRVEVKGIEVGAGEVMLNHFLAMDPGTVGTPVPGIETREPAFGLPALWIEAGRREEAELAGYTVVDPPSVLATHLTEIVKSYAHELLGRQETKVLVDNLKEEYPAVVEELVPGVLTIGEIQRVLQNLLRENIPIRNLVTILEALADSGRAAKDPDYLTENARQALARQITRQYTSEDGVMHVVTVDPALEDRLLQALTTYDHGTVLAVEPGLGSAFVQALAREAEKLAAAGHLPVLVCDARLRPHVKRLAERSLPRLAVLSYNEITRDADVQATGVVCVSAG